MRQPVRALFFVIVTVAFLVRLVTLAAVSSFSPYTLGADSALYDEVAQSILTGNGIMRDGHPTAVTVPGYPIFLAAVYALLGRDLAMVGIVQAAIGALSAGLAAVIAARLAARPGAAAGWWTGALVAVYPHFLIWTGFALTETLFIALTLLGLWLLIEGQLRNLTWLFFCSGLSLALAVMVRGNLAPYVPLAAVVAWRLGSGRAALMRSAAILLPVGAALTPWIVRNAIVLGTPTLASETAVVMWAGNNPNASARHVNGYVYSEPLPEPVPPGATEREGNAYYDRAVRAYLSAHPLALFQHMPAKLANMWRPTFGGARLGTWAVFGTSYVFLMAMSVIGLVQTLIRPIPPALRYLQIYVAVLTAAHAIGIAEIRYRMPIEAVLAVFAGIAIASFTTRLRRRWGSRFMAQRALAGV